ncbi:DnaJ domain-containing protein [Limibacillus halophilus]|jgi:hypothetical protein
MVIPYLVLALSLLAGIFFLLKWFAQAPPGTVVKTIVWTLAIIAGIGVLLLAFLKRYQLAVFFLPFLLPVLTQLPSLWRRFKAARGGTRGQSSKVNTRFLRMMLDHDSGTMDGEVVEGRFAGRYLSELSLEELLELWRHCHADDEDSLAVLEAYLDRTQSEDWRARLEEEEAAGSRARQGGGGGSFGGGAMDREEAFAILGLQEGASKEDIRAAHRRLMRQVHPDHGGSNYLAARINEAKALLLGE